MASRNFNRNIQSTIRQEDMVTNFENMLKKVSNMIGNNGAAYSVWIKFVIGKNESTQIVLNSSSQNKEENTVMSLNYKKSGAGIANSFTLKVAVDLCDFGQKTRGRVEQFDELIYQAMNATSYENAIDRFYCQFQYGYNVYGDTQIVSPLYTGLITGIKPSINYANGISTYTITGTSYILGTSNTYDFDAIGDPTKPKSGWNAADLVLWNMWKYHGNPETINQVYDSGYIKRKGSTGTDADDRHDDVKNGISSMFNIDISENIWHDISNVQMEKETTTAIEYCRHVLQNARNKTEPSYDEATNSYKLDEDDFIPYYTLYFTDSGNSGVPTAHVAYVGSNSQATEGAGVRTVNFEFSWFDRKNNIVLDWNPEVNLMSYLTVRAKLESEKDKLDKNRKQQLADALDEETILRIDKEYEESLLEIQNTNIEYHTATLTLVGIPSDIPLNIMLNVKPKIFESISRTQGLYYLTSSEDTINTNGLFTTKLTAIKYKNTK